MSKYYGILDAESKYFVLIDTNQQRLKNTLPFTDYTEEDIKEYEEEQVERAYTGTWYLKEHVPTGTKIPSSPLLPIGTIYFQLSGQEAPNVLFGGTWTNISSEYAGRFFRAEGGSAAEFGADQAGGAPGSKTYIGRVEHGTAYPPASISSTVPKQTWPDAAWDTDSLSFVYADISKGNSIYGSATEVRPINSTMRVWKRTA